MPAGEAFLPKRFGIELDAALKPQGAPGMDIDCALPDGTRIVGELKDDEALSTRLRRGAKTGDHQRPAPPCRNGRGTPLHVCHRRAQLPYHMQTVVRIARTGRRSRGPR